MRRCHPILTLGLVLSLILGSLALGHVRLQPRIAGWVELCIGAEAVTVAVDARGQPIRHDHPLCADCLPAVLAMDAPVETGRRSVAFRHDRLIFWQQASAPRPAPTGLHLPRGPPDLA